MIASLDSWHNATVIGVTSEFPDEDKPDLRSMIGTFAGALFIWWKKQKSRKPIPNQLLLWKEMCEKEVLPEIKYSFDIWNHL